MGAVRNHRVIAIWIDQRYPERLGEIEGEKSARQVPGRRVGMAGLGGGAADALLRDGGKAMVRRNDDIGAFAETKFGKRGADAPEVIVGIADGGQGSLAIDAGRERQEAITLIVLGAVRIARPEH